MSVADTKRKNEYMKTVIKKWKKKKKKLMNFSITHAKKLKNVYTRRYIWNLSTQAFQIQYVESKYTKSLNSKCGKQAHKKINKKLRETANKLQNVLGNI